MPLAPGTRLGSYEGIPPLGAGGMGEVYRARDPRLNRSVAIKVLAPLFASDAERLSRFAREAQVLASLNHPNIAQVYGFEHDALVMELVEGPTLADRIARGPIPIDEAIAIARQIADALDAAHAQGIVHRDLKPANVKVRDDGTVKVLDFGLAKLAGPDGAAQGFGPDAANSPTLASPGTQIGVILGTAAYMAPEQAKGKTVDRRADIWAFGVVLYEMLAGKPLFNGETISDVLAAVLKDEPNWSGLPPATPPSIRRLLTRTAERDPKKRLHAMADARLELDAVEAAMPAAASAAARPPRSILPMIAVAALTGGVITAAAFVLAS